MLLCIWQVQHQRGAIRFDEPMACRGMRLSDTIFLTLAICLLQVYIGMRCLYEVHRLPPVSLLSLHPATVP